MALIKGIPVVLYDRVQTGVDGFNAPVYKQIPVTIDNVLVCPSGTQDIVQDAQMHGKRAEYELCIPKGDTHVWENRDVEFFGAKWHTIGFVTEYIAGNTPLDWNRRVKVERYG